VLIAMKDSYATTIRAEIPRQEKSAPTLNAQLMRIAIPANALTTNASAVEQLTVTAKAVVRKARFAIPQSVNVLLKVSRHLPEHANPAM
jgi:hypothetical protein